MCYDLSIQPSIKFFLLFFYLVLNLNLVFGSNSSPQIIPVYAVKYPLFLSQDENKQLQGLIPELVTMLNKQLKPTTQLELKILPPKRLIQQFNANEIKILFHSPTHFDHKIKSKILLLPLIKLIDRYAAIKKIEHIKKPKLAYFIGDTEEAQKKGKDKYQRIGIAKPSGLFPMLIADRVDLINCLVPTCQYLAKKAGVQLKYHTKSLGIDTTYGGIIIKPGQVSPVLLQKLKMAFQKAYKSSDYQNLMHKTANKIELDINQLAIRNSEIIDFFPANDSALFK